MGASTAHTRTMGGASGNWGVWSIARSGSSKEEHTVFVDILSRSMRVSAPQQYR